ncbi:MAG TPA: glycosyltransferase [Gallicola sp.]|jgi:glycosyltransferase|nr:glycosyltransferase [Gallicola sp.]
MKVSIVTICYNNELDIRHTIESVINQTYHNIEYIIVDGNSKDSTLNIVNEYSGHISKIISEPDNGLYDAINKGIKIATGDIVGLIHAGDQLFDYEVVSKIATHFANNDIDISYGNSVIVNGRGKVKRVNKSPEFKKSLINRGWMPSHQSIYVRRELFDKFGYYRVDIGYASDYEWFLRYFLSNDAKIELLDEFILRFTLGGISSSNYSKMLKKDYKNQINNCWILNDLTPPIGLIYLKWLQKPKQYIRALFYK